MKYKYSIGELEMMGHNPWLTDREKQVFELFYRRGWQIPDISEEIGWSCGTVKNILKSIREKHLNYKYP